VKRPLTSRFTQRANQSSKPEEESIDAVLGGALGGAGEMIDLHLGEHRSRARSLELALRPELAPVSMKNASSPSGHSRSTG